MNILIRTNLFLFDGYKILDGYEDIDTECFFTIDSYSYTCGHPFKLKKVRGNMVRHISIFSYRIVNDWNSLPSSSSSSRKVQLQKSEDKRTALVSGM